MGGRGGGSGLGKGNSLAFLGRRGKPKDMGAALAGSNPHFSEGEVWQRNCQRCVYAYEMQRRGYDVEAMPRILNGTDKLPYDDDPEGWPNVMKGAKLSRVPGEDKVQGMLDMMAGWGDGARAIVKVKWVGVGFGHVFMAEQEKDGTVFLDPQTGKYVDIGALMSVASPLATRLMRIDNLEPGPLLEKCVSRRRSK